MKKIARLTSLTLFIILFFYPEIFAQGQMKIVYFYDFKPYSWKAENGQMKGILIDILNESLHNKMGIELNHRGYPWARAQLFVKTGEADAFVTIPTPERKSYTIINPETIFDLTATIFTNKGNPIIKNLRTIKSISDLKDFKQVQYTGNGWANKNFNGMDVRWVPTLSTALQRLARGHYDCFVASSTLVNYNIKELGLQDKIVEIQGVVFSREGFHLCIGTNSSYVKILPKFDETIQKMRLDGSLEKIIHKYLK